MALPKLQLTLEQFLKLPEESPSLELMDGAVSQKVSPQQQHSALQLWFAEAINRFARPRKLALALPETRGVFGRDSLVPDVAVYRWSRIPRDERGRVADDVTVLPDIAIEIVSPGQSIPRQLAKCRRYLAAGVAIVLHVNPRDDTVRRFAVGEPEQGLTGGDRIDLDRVLPGFELTAAEVFSALNLD